MDPNAALAQIREITRRILAGQARGDDANDLAELVDGLDKRLSNRGSMPDAWHVAGIGNSGRYGRREKVFED
jgi:hypothetical protein